MIYISSSCMRNKYISETIVQLAQNGVRNIELSGGTNYYSKLEDDLIELKKRYNLNYVCHAYFPPPEKAFVVNLASCDDDIYQQTISHYERCIRLMDRLESMSLSIHAGFLVRVGAREIGRKLKNSVIYDEEKAYDRFCNAYGYIEDLCHKNGIILYLENNVLNSENYLEFDEHNYLMMTDYKSIMRMREKMDFNLLLDLGHLNVSANTLQLNFQKECNELRNYVKWIHISENNGREDQHLPIRGQSLILEMLKKIYKEGINITLETVGSVNDVINSLIYVEELF